MIACYYDDKIVHVDKMPVCGLSAHDLLIAVFSFHSIKYQSSTVKYRDFSKFSEDLFRKDIHDAEWHEICNHSDIDDKISVFNWLSD